MLAANQWPRISRRTCVMTTRKNRIGGRAKIVPALAALLFALAATVLGQNTMFASQGGAAPSPPEAVNEVSASELVDTVVALQSFGPSEGISSRAFYLNSTDSVATYIYDRFADLGLYATYQEFEISGRELKNVIAVKNGTDLTAPCILFGAHYDSENYLVDNASEAVLAYGAAPGADDDASGVAAVLEIARVLGGFEFRNSMKFAAFTAEEAGYDHSGGLKGSSYFAWSERSAAVPYLGTVIMDMIGCKAGSQNALKIVKAASTDQFADAILHAVDEYEIDLAISTLVDPMADYSDHYPFWSYGYPSILLIEEFTYDGYPVNPNYHTANDTYDKLSEEQMLVTVKAAVAGVLDIMSPDDRNGTNIYPVVLVVVLVAAVAAYIAVKARKAD